MSQRLELDVVAEGVETPEQVAFLTAPRPAPRTGGGPSPPRAAASAA
jgi:hypothetical protein